MAAESVSDSISAAASELSGGEAPSDASSIGPAPDTASEPAAPSVHDTLEAAAAERQAAERERGEFDEVFKPYADRLKQAGHTRAAATRTAFAMAEQMAQLVSDPRQAFAAIGQHLRSQGLDPAQILTAAAAAPSPPAGISPQTVRQAEHVISEFANTRDERGQPRYPDFAEHREDMGRCLETAAQRGLSLSLPQAYQTVVGARRAIGEFGAGRPDFAGLSARIGTLMIQDPNLDLEAAYRKAGGRHAKASTTGHRPAPQSARETLDATARALGMVAA